MHKTNQSAEQYRVITLVICTGPRGSNTPSRDSDYLVWREYAIGSWDVRRKVFHWAVMYMLQIRMSFFRLPADSHLF